MLRARTFREARDQMPERGTSEPGLAGPVGICADDRAHGLAWLQENAADILDFEVLAENERAGR
jgi:hypothetical protein